MDLTFRIIWFEDVDEWYNTTSRRVSRYIKNKNFKVDIMRIKKASDFDLTEYQLQNYDLLIIDYDLEKIYEKDCVKSIYGTDIIHMIRNGNFLNDILFYSSHGFDIINQVMKREGLEGVFLADRNNGEFIEKVQLLIDKAIRRAENLINIRGIVMDTTSGFDNKIRDLVSIMWPVLGDKEAEIANNIDDLLNERDFSAIRQARLLSWCIESNEMIKRKFQEILKKYLYMSNGEVHDKFFELYKNDIVLYRNALAHIKNTPSIDSKVIIGEVDGKAVQFDQQLCDALRKKLLSYENILDEMYMFIESNF